MLILQGAGNFAITGTVRNGSGLVLLRTNSGALTVSGISTYAAATTEQTWGNRSETLL